MITNEIGYISGTKSSFCNGYGKFCKRAQTERLIRCLLWRTVAYFHWRGSPHRDILLGLNELSICIPCRKCENRFKSNASYDLIPWKAMRTYARGNTWCDRRSRGVDHVKTFHTHRKVQLDAYIGNTWHFYELLSPVRDARSTIVKFVIFIVSIY